MTLITLYLIITTVWSISNISGKNLSSSQNQVAFRLVTVVLKSLKLPYNMTANALHQVLHWWAWCTCRMASLVPTAERVPRPFHTYLNEDIPPLFLDSLFALVNLFCGYCTPILKALLQTNLSFPGDSVVKNPPANTGDTGSMPGWGRVPGEGNGNPLQYSCLGNPMGKSIITHQVISTLTSLVKHNGSWSRTAKPTVAAKVILPVWHSGAGTGTQHAPSQYQPE